MQYPGNLRSFFNGPLPSSYTPTATDFPLDLSSIHHLPATEWSSYPTTLVGPEPQQRRQNSEKTIRTSTVRFLTFDIGHV